MSENTPNGCTHDCSTCGLDCPSKKSPESLLEPINRFSKVKKVIAVVSGKGGVGKSMVTSLLALTMRRRGYNVSIMDADITGPSIPRAFGLKCGGAEGDENGIIPPETATGIKVMSVNLLLDNESTPVIWRGPVIAGTVKQFWTDVMWGYNDIMFIDMPPGTGDVPLTIFQSIPLDGIIIVTSPQELVSMIVAKAVNMANMMNIPVLGLVENMSYVECPDCGKKINIFGESATAKIAEEYGLSLLDSMPISPELAHMCDIGRIEMTPRDWLENAADAIEKIEK